MTTPVYESEIEANEPGSFLNHHYSTTSEQCEEFALEARNAPGQEIRRKSLIGLGLYDVGVTYRQDANKRFLLKTYH